MQREHVTLGSYKKTIDELSLFRAEILSDTTD